MAYLENSKRKRVTLQEIAGLAGVSVSTASLVLSGKGTASRISTDVDRRVRQVAMEKDYAPNLLVRSMQQGRTNVLSFYSAFRNRERDDMYLDRLTAALERSAGKCGYDLLTHCRVGQSPEEVYLALNGGRADGLLFFGPNEGDPLLSLLRTSRLPTVILNHVDRLGGISYVTEDMEDGIRQIGEALVSRGHRRIAMVSSSTVLSADAPSRVNLLRQFLAEKGVLIPDRWIVSADEKEGHSPTSALQFLINEPEPPTALFCWHDRVGYRMLEACGNLGVSVPDQLSLVGYDGLHWPSTSAHLLASVFVDLDLLVEKSISFLDRLILGEPGPLQTMFPVSFEPGTTLRPVR